MMTTETVRAQINPDMTIQLALGGDTEALQRVIDLELDAHGRAVGFDLANSIWHRFSELPNKVKVA